MMSGMRRMGTRRGQRAVISGVLATLAVLPIAMTPASASPATTLGQSPRLTEPAASATALAQPPRLAVPASPTTALAQPPRLAIPASPATTPQTMTIAGGPTSATDPTPVRLDVDVYRPQQAGPAPVVVLAHGFGGSKLSVADQARALANAGFIAIAYSARGFGRSTGSISMDSPQFEVADVRRIIDVAATLPGVQLDAPGDPRVAVVGASYGGALALLAAGYDHRIDAVAADITYNSLQQALFPQQADGSATIGVFKKLWTAGLFSAGTTTIPGRASICGRFAPQWCALYQQAVRTGTVDAQGLAMLRASSPASVTDRITAPTLLMAGQADSLFPLSQADATAHQIATAHPATPLKVVWHSGGHDGGISEQARLDQLVIDWCNEYLRHRGHVNLDFEATLVTGPLLGRSSGTKTTIERATRYPGIDGQHCITVPLTAQPQQVLAPAGGVPAAISSLPGLGAAASLLSRPVPGQTAVFTSAPITQPLTIVGSSRVRITVSSAQPVTDVVLFGSLRLVTPAGVEVLPEGLVAPIRLASVGPAPTTVTVDLPAIYTSAEPGDVLRVEFSTTDFAYRAPERPAVYTVALADPRVAIASSDLLPVSAATPAWWWTAGAAVIVTLLLLLVWVRRPWHRAADVREDLRDVPVAVEGLAKEFAHGLRAVDGITYRIPRGEVIGLLGPNGAGKTTTMRMLLGLILPTEGDVYVFGTRVTPGDPVLARVGALVEGPGFLPHLTGRQNLDLFWQACGRPDVDPNLDEILAIANLGTAIDRKVRTYSQGMRQRLGVAQAMLGMPDLLVLDEPTNGLDPQQIREMREVVQRYAATGRTVIVSSHLLSEVEQTCSHVVVMHRGRLVVQGDTATLLAGRTHMHLEDFFMDVIGDDLAIGTT